LITFDSPLYQDSLDEAKILYEKVLLRFIGVVEQGQTSANLLEIITKEPDHLLVQLLRVVRKYLQIHQLKSMLK
jgi:hypothetical protein